LSFLEYKGIDKIDWLVVSHADDDHAGGVSALARRIGLGQIYAGEKLPDIGLQVTDCVAGRVWRADGIEYQFLHPGQGNTFSGNDSSCVLTISAGRNRLVLTGDIELAGENSVLPRLPPAGANVVIIPHHGSLTSSSPPFVNRLRPGLAIASVGYANRWGFPKQQVTRRWEGAGADVLDTASSGAISLRLCGRNGVSRLREERVRQRRFWHDRLKL
jgi:competence protein ComEC